ncbi:MAG: ribonuclease [Desulfobulbus propionicus]|nr:MAG: ribonuclease [Desulfobulbus propionicus]
MYTDILINATNYENRVALVDHGQLLEFFIERPAEKGLVGNIYRGRVVRVLPGMQAAFVDIGLERTGFLYVDDVLDTLTNLDRYHQDFLDGVDTVPREATATDAQPAIDTLLREGQEVLVQISKDPIGSKGARLTCHITLPGRNLVFMPLTDHIGVSRKIEDEVSRTRLREMMEQLRPNGSGFIVRTVAENISEAELKADMEFLLLLWEEVLTRAAKAKIPSLVHKDLDIIHRSVRDLFTDQVNELVIDSQAAYDSLIEFISSFAPKLRHRITLYKDPLPLFEAYSIEMDINRALDKKVWLRSGGYIIIETTEALTVIDVNTGRYVGKTDLEATIFKTNMEAVKEIAYQLKLRNIGGIIIIDFIDMESENNREELYASFQEAMRRDKSKVNILKLSEFGLIQMTRKRQSESLTQLLCEPCHYCGGDGFIKSARTICYEIFRTLTRDADKVGAAGATLRTHPKIAEMLLGEESLHFQELERQLQKRFTIIANPDMHIRQFDITWNA